MAFNARGWWWFTCYAGRSEFNGMLVRVVVRAARDATDARIQGSHSDTLNESCPWTLLSIFIHKRYPVACDFWDEGAHTHANGMMLLAGHTCI